MSRHPNRFQHISYILLALIAIFILLTFKQHGISNDELVQHTYGRLLVDFYQSGFNNQSAFHYKNLYLYGGFFDLIAALMEKITNFWLWDLRHLLSAIFGLLGFVAVYKTATEIAGERAGFFAILLLAVTASWSGAMFTHTKDIPFATCMVWALYYTVVLMRHLPNIPLSISLKLGIATGCALGMRIGGGFAVVYLLLTLIYAGLLLGSKSLHLKSQQSSFKSRIQFWITCILRLLPAAIIAFLLMAFFWPWGIMSPTHPFEAIKAFSYFSFNMFTIDDGKVFSIGSVPRSYLLSYLMVKLPEVFLIGLLSFITVIPSLLKYLSFKHTNNESDTQKSLGILAVVIAVTFPLVFVFLTKPALYNGVRHFTFILPPLAILAGLGFDKVLIKIKKSLNLTIIYLIICIVLLLITISKLIQLHPYEYVYYNHFAGSASTAETHWESDYWSSSLREASKALTNLSFAHREQPYLVAVCAESIQGSAYLDERFKITKDWRAADFYMSTTNMHCDQVLQGEVISEVKRGGTILSVVKDRRQLVGDARIPTPAPN